MENVPPFIVITVLLGLAFQLLQLFGVKISPNDVKKFIALRGRTLAWNTYLIIAILITIYFLLTLSLVISYISFSISLATLIVLILWALLGVWAPAIQRLHNKRINATVQIMAVFLITLTVIGFWVVKWPEIQQPFFVTLLLLAVFIILIVEWVIKKRDLTVRTYLGKYWQKVKPCWNDGWILPNLKSTFFLLSHLSIGVVIPDLLEKKHGSKCRYLFVDSYVVFWVALVFIFTFITVKNDLVPIRNCFFLALLSYRLFEIFQSWISQYVLGGVRELWIPRNIHRSLILVFVDYMIVVFSYALLVFILRDNFGGVDRWEQSLLYSFGNAFGNIPIAMASMTFVGYVLLVTQIMFTILFLTAVINRIFAVMK